MIYIIGLVLITVILEIKIITADWTDLEIKLNKTYNMENIVIVEKLCEKLQESDRPTDLGIAIALRVILDENIILTERAENERELSGKLTVARLQDTQKIKLLTLENHSLKQANTILTAEIERANKIVDFYKAFTSGKYKVLRISNLSQLQDFVSPEVQDFLQGKGLGKSNKTALLKPQQTSIQFPENIPTVNISEEEKQKSIYYKSAKRRATKIWRYIGTYSLYKEGTKHIVDWGAVFHLMPGEPIKYAHIEAACMPKCYGGLGIAVGMKLENWVDSQIKTR